MKRLLVTDQRRSLGAFQLVLKMGLYILMYGLHLEDCKHDSVHFGYVHQSWDFLELFSLRLWRHTN